MKCVKHVTSGKVQRIPDSQATALTMTDKWNYCSKEEWKESVRTKPKTQEKTWEDKYNGQKN